MVLVRTTTTHECEIVGELNQMTNSRWEHYSFGSVLQYFSRLQQVQFEKVPILDNRKRFEIGETRFESANGLRNGN